MSKKRRDENSRFRVTEDDLRSDRGSRRSSLVLVPRNAVRPSTQMEEEPRRDSRRDARPPPSDHDSDDDEPYRVRKRKKERKPQRENSAAQTYSPKRERSSMAIQTDRSDPRVERTPPRTKRTPPPSAPVKKASHRRRQPSSSESDHDDGPRCDSPNCELCKLANLSLGGKKKRAETPPRRRLPTPPPTPPPTKTHSHKKGRKKKPPTSSPSESEASEDSDDPCNVIDGFIKEHEEKRSKKTTATSSRSRDSRNIATSKGSRNTSRKYR